MDKYSYIKIRDNGDATSNYILSGNFPVTFRDFVTSILAQTNSFMVEITDNNNWLDTRIEFKKDSDDKWNIIKCTPDGWFTNDTDRKVISCWANGGYGQMLYFVTFES